MYTVLGISLTHEASAALMQDGKVVAVAAEERFSRIKNDITYPKQAIDFCLEWGRVDPKSLDAVVLGGTLYPYETFKFRRESQFSVDDWVHEQRAYWYPKLFKKRNVSYDEAFRGRKHLVIDSSFDPWKQGLVNGDLLPVIKKKIQDHLSIDDHAIHTVEHELCHQFYAYFASQLRRDGIILTSEGTGDYSNGTVSVVTNHHIIQKSFSTENHLAHLYRYTTLLLGMKPNEHEYKVMGLAPYASEHEKEKVLLKLRGIFKVKGLDIQIDRAPKDFYFSIRDLFEGCRFDGIAGGVQEYLEEILCEWTTNVCKKLNAHTLYFSGGVAQNIKACKKMAELPFVKRFSVMPMSGDGSIALGAAYSMTAKHFQKEKKDRKTIEPLTNTYLGPSFPSEEVNRQVKSFAHGKGYKIVSSPSVHWLIDQLTQGKICARFSGRMEFGQRALGNRSILADPRDQIIIERINKMIKHRDFWMPFTPTILDSREKDYVMNPKKLDGRWMTMAFDSTKKAQQHFPAALHPADKTVRPQILKEKENPSYYAILKIFEKETGVGALLNTSFNLHGEPIVCSPKDAIDTFNRSELDVLLFDHLAICRR